MNGEERDPDEAADRGARGMPHASATLGGSGERGVLAEVFAALEGQPTHGVLVGPGDDTALLTVRRGAVLATTDTMVRDRDWRDAWSSGRDVGVKIVTQNLADLAAMGGAGTGLLVTLVAPTDLPVAWARDLTEGIAWAARRATVPVVGGDLSSAPAGLVSVSVTALGELGSGVDSPVLRSGARPGDVLAVSGPLGRSGAGWWLLQKGRTGGDLPGSRALLDHHLRPLTDLGQGPLAARAGATSMIDVSDGLVRDGDRLARASGVRLVLDETAVEELASRLGPAVPDDVALAQVLGGGEEHELLATFPSRAAVPAGWVHLGGIDETLGPSTEGPKQGGGSPGVWWRGRPARPELGGWDHFGG